MSTVAVMQPYWIPYAGYFRLFNAASVFVVLDDVQFPRRGYVHRNKLLNINSSPDWITLPIKKASRDTLISNLEFKPNASQLIEDQRRKFPVLKDGFGVIHQDMRFDRPFVETIVESLKTITKVLDLQCEWYWSSNLGENHLKGQDRILALVKSVGGSRYVNLAGGLELYEHELFNRSNIELTILPGWQGPFVSVLQYLSTNEDKNWIKRLICEQTQTSPAPISRGTC